MQFCFVYRVSGSAELPAKPTLGEDAIVYHDFSKR